MFVIIIISIIIMNDSISDIEQSPNHRHRNLRAFEEHDQNMCLIVSLQSNTNITLLG